MAAPAIERPASASFYRPSIGYAAAHSMADTLPSVNFDFDNLREHMALFTARFDDFIETGRRRVLEDRNKFRVNVAEIHGVFFYL